MAVQNDSLVLLSHLFLHVSSVLGSSGSHAHELWLTQELHPGGLHPNRHSALLKPTKEHIKSRSGNLISISYCHTPFTSY